jgi:VanZ family protein
MASPPSPGSRSDTCWRSVLFAWGPVAAYAALIFALSSVSNVPPLPGGMSDKTGHVLLYSGFGFLVARALGAGRSQPRTIWLVLGTILVVGLYGLSDETHQLFVPNRQFDLHDLAADLAGGAGGTACHWLWGIIGPGSARSGPA